MPEQRLPLVRGLLARGSLMPLLTVAGGGQPSTTPDAAPTSGPALEAWRARCASLPAEAAGFELEGIGPVQIRWPARAGRANRRNGVERH